MQCATFICDLNPISKLSYRIRKDCIALLHRHMLVKNVNPMHAYSAFIIFVYELVFAEDASQNPIVPPICKRKRWNGRFKHIERNETITRFGNNIYLYMAIFFLQAHKSHDEHISHPMKSNSCERTPNTVALSKTTGNMVLHRERFTSNEWYDSIRMHFHFLYTKYLHFTCRRCTCCNIVS